MNGIHSKHQGAHPFLDQRNYENKTWGHFTNRFFHNLSRTSMKKGEENPVLRIQNRLNELSSSIPSTPRLSEAEIKELYRQSSLASSYRIPKIIEKNQYSLLFANNRLYLLFAQKDDYIGMEVFNTNIVHVKKSTEKTIYSDLELSPDVKSIKVGNSFFLICEPKKVSQTVPSVSSSPDSVDSILKYFHGELSSHPSMTLWVKQLNTVTLQFDLVLLESDKDNKHLGKSVVNLLKEHFNHLPEDVKVKIQSTKNKLSHFLKLELINKRVEAELLKVILEKFDFSKYPCLKNKALEYVNT